MSVSILEALQNAEINLKGSDSLGTRFRKDLAANQLHNAIQLLLKGYSVHDEVQPLLEEYGQVENVPDKDS